MVSASFCGWGNYFAVNDIQQKGYGTMLTPRQFLPEANPSTENIAVLLVTPHSQDENILREMLASSDSIQLTRCATTEDALPQICSLMPAVVICERDLPDGTWKAILGTCEALSKPPLLVVTSRHADENLWAEVLNLGGYDVLMKPFAKDEVSRVLASSYRQWHGLVGRYPISSQANTSLSTQTA